MRPALVYRYDVKSNPPPGQGLFATQVLNGIGAAFERVR